MAAMRRGSSLDGVEAAVRSMEDSGVFNAGRGACLTLQGTVELDAAVMTGEEARGAGVGVCTCTYHAVSLARFVMESTEHALVAGKACEFLARKAGMNIENLTPSKASLDRFSALLKRLSEAHPKNFALMRQGDASGSTVGAVALDSDGVPSAAVSTGGVWMKLPGRVGDSAVIGAGIYADRKSGAACATGNGEEIIRNVLSWNACSYLKNLTAKTAARRAIGLITRRSGRGTAGIITVDLEGRVGFAFNTEAMGTAWYDHVKARPILHT